MKPLYFLVLLFTASSANAQVGIGTTNPNSSASLDIVSTTQGVLFPRMTAAERAAIQNPAEGLFVFQTNGTKGLYFFDGTSWRNMATGLVPNVQGVANSLSGIGATSVFAGSGAAEFFNGPLLSAGFLEPFGITSMGGSIYVSDPIHDHLRKLSTTSVTSIDLNYSGLQNIATQDFYIYASTAVKIVKIDVNLSGVPPVFAGSDAQGSVDGSGVNARFYPITSMTGNRNLNLNHNLYVTEFNSSNGTGRIRVISPQADVTTLSCVDVNGNAVQFLNLQGIVTDGQGNIYVSEIATDRIYKITGNVATVIYGSGTTIAPDMNAPTKMDIDAAGNLYVVEENRKIRKITPSGESFLLVGSPEVTNPIQFGSIRGIHLFNGFLYFTDAVNNKVYKVVI